MKHYLLILLFFLSLTFSANAKSLIAKFPFQVCEKIMRAAGPEKGNQCIEIVINKKTNPYVNAICYRIAGASNEYGLKCLKNTIGHLFENIEFTLFNQLFKRSGSDMKGTIENLRVLTTGKFNQCVNNESDTLIREGVIITADISHSIQESCLESALNY